MLLLYSDPKWVGEAGLGPELAAAFEAVLELAALGLHGAAADRDALIGEIGVVDVVLVGEEILGCGVDGVGGMGIFGWRRGHERRKGLNDASFLAVAELV